MRKHTSTRKSSTSTFNPRKFDVAEYDRILANGLSMGLGERGERVCIEAAICQTLGLPHGDDPGCVDPAVRAYKIALNDSDWSSPEARADGLRDLGLAQLGSKGVIDSSEFAKRLAEKTIRVLIPALFRETFPNNPACFEAANRCEQEGTEAAARSAASEASAARSAAWSAAASAAWSAARSAAQSAAQSEASAAQSAASAAWSAAQSDKYLILSAQLALHVLRELKSPGVELLSKR